MRADGAKGINTIDWNATELSAPYGGNAVDACTMTASPVAITPFGPNVNGWQFVSPAHWFRLCLKTGIALTLPSPASGPQAGEGTLEAASRPVNAFSNKA
jgi:hypothetical protein